MGLVRGEDVVVAPELPAALRLLCEFYKPRSPLLHQLQLLLARASAALSPGGGASHHDRDEGSASLEVYRALRRLLRPGGVLFHYVGDPASKASGRLFKGVLQRLREAGFDAKTTPAAYGITAVAR